MLALIDGTKSLESLFFIYQRFFSIANNCTDVCVVLPPSTEQSSPRDIEAAVRVMATIALFLSLAPEGRLFFRGTNVQGHFQAIKWVDRDIPADAWVGAVQTGTLGYWHDRTINQDGKVNPEALQARSEQGSVLDYVVESKISYLAVGSVPPGSVRGRAWTLLA